VIDASLDVQLRALRERRAFVRPSARVVEVSGDDATAWLNDLLTAGVETLPEGGSVRSLLLSPTGHVRADVVVLATRDAHVLVQGDDQPDAIDALLAPYVLSSAVELRSIAASPVLVPADGAWAAAADPPAGAIEASREAAEAWRIGAAIAVFPVDLDASSIPAEAGLDRPPVTDVGKGCFLGQESVARVRNLGHAPRTVLALRCDGPVVAGQRVEGETGVAGIVTSAAPDSRAGGSVLLARVRWDAREQRLSTPDGASLRPREPAA
jgi:folate-binding protein YgfZ